MSEESSIKIAARLDKISTVGSSKQPTRVAIESSCELYLPLSLFFKAVAHTLLSTHINAFTVSHTVMHT